MFFSEVINSSNTGYLDEICTNDIIYCDPVWLQAPLRGRQRLGRYLSDLQHAYPDLLVQLVRVCVCVHSVPRRLFTWLQRLTRPAHSTPSAAATTVRR